LSEPLRVATFIAESFPGLRLRSPLFYSWPIGIRFELTENSLANVANHSNVDQALARATTLFEALFSEDETGFLVAYSWPHPQRQDAVLHRVLGAASGRIARSVGTDLYDQRENTDDDSPYDRIEVELIPRQLDYKLMAAAVDEKRGLADEEKLWWDVFLINRTRELVYHHYDDRGLDVVARRSTTLRPIYLQFRDWILDYDRDAIDRVFAARA
jgi:hypothetical protein